MGHQRYVQLAEAGRPEDGAPGRIGTLAGRGVLFTAPHAVPHQHHDDPARVKPADRFTGQLAQVVAAETGAAALWVQPPWPGNANADALEQCLFKQQVLAVVGTGTVGFTCDLHGMTDAHGMDVCIGCGGAQDHAALEVVCATFDAHGLSWTIDEPFSAQRPGTVTRTLVNAGHRALQFEMAARVRDPWEEPSQRMFAALCAIAAEIC